MAVVESQSALSPDHPIDVICGSLSAKLFLDKLKDGFSRCISFTAGNGSFMTQSSQLSRIARETHAFDSNLTLGFATHAWFCKNLTHFSETDCLAL